MGCYALFFIIIRRELEDMSLNVTVLYSVEIERDSVSLELMYVT